MTMSEMLTIDLQYKIVSLQYIDSKYVLVYNRGMSLEDNILRLIHKKKVIRTSEVSDAFGVSRQYAHRMLKNCIKRGDIIKVGGTRGARYMFPGSVPVGHRFEKRFRNRSLDESNILADIQKKEWMLFRELPDNVYRIFQYAFLEMVNNAIEHSWSNTISICIERGHDDMIFSVNDAGIGVFQSIRKKKKLSNELDAVQDLLKGKTTTKPRSHSGEGIFFTSKVADMLSVESHRLRLIVDTVVDDVFLEELSRLKRGTRVQFRISTKSKRNLIRVFKMYQTDSQTLAFDKTAVRVKLFAIGGDYLSRSHARRVLAGLEQFRSVMLDFDHIPAVGQAFADEIFRVFQDRHPDIVLRAENMNSAVRFMVERGGG